MSDSQRRAADALRRLRFGRRVQAQYADLRDNCEAWADYLAEAESTHVRDGLD
ncbi:hypothetical protein [Candidatus Poriferisodalis sp.]|uniref:hypothetical protein n=1 Tax=Candidatus Poriferisodalis sp. TaxID=3101277 RepID=UPI003B02B970